MKQHTGHLASNTNLALAQKQVDGTNTVVVGCSACTPPACCSPPPHPFKNFDAKAQSDKERDEEKICVIGVICG